MEECCHLHYFSYLASRLFLIELFCSGKIHNIIKNNAPEGWLGSLGVPYVPVADNRDTVLPGAAVAVQFQKQTNGGSRSVNQLYFF